MLALRSFRLDDQTAARALVEEGLAEHFGFSDRSANVDLVNIATSYAAPNAFFVAECAGKLVGTAGLIVEGKTGRLVRVAVSAKRRRSGIAASLLSYIDEYARRTGLSELLAHTQPEWSDAMSFYRSQGFHQYGRDGIDVYLRRRVNAMSDPASGSRDDSVITAPDARTLVEILCTQYGFCLSPLWRARLGKNPPQTVSKFTDAVFRAEGLDPNTADSTLYKAVEEEVRQAFERSAENQITR